jgi:hypothetical protein
MDAARSLFLERGFDGANLDLKTLMLLDLRGSRSKQTASLGIANSLGSGLLEPRLRLSHLQAATGGDAGEASMEVTVNVKS